MKNERSEVEHNVLIIRQSYRKQIEELQSLLDEQQRINEEEKQEKLDTFEVNTTNFNLININLSAGSR